VTNQDKKSYSNHQSHFLFHSFFAKVTGDKANAKNNQWRAVIVASGGPARHFSFGLRGSELEED
jgi:hypothetical protein